MRGFAQARFGANVSDWLAARDERCSLVTGSTEAQLAELFEGNAEEVTNFRKHRDIAVLMLAVDPERCAVPVDLVRGLPVAAAEVAVHAFRDLHELLDGPRQLAADMPVVPALDAYLDMPGGKADLSVPRAGGQAYRANSPALVHHLVHGMSHGSAFTCMWLPIASSCPLPPVYSVPCNIS